MLPCSVRAREVTTVQTVISTSWLRSHRTRMSASGDTSLSFRSSKIWFLCRWTFQTEPLKNPMSGHPPNAKRFMHSESLQVLLYDIRDNILYAQGLLTGISYEAFKGSRTHFYAATRALEIISEASRRLPDEVRERHPHFPWRAIRDAGNVYRHQYDIVEESRVWDT